jgi:hypothetical protein
MKNRMHLQSLLTASKVSPRQQVVLFALLTLGIIDSLANGLMSANAALRVFFHAENCRFVRTHLRDKVADRIMSHGVQLPDLYEALSTEEAQREFQSELATMRALCLKLLEAKHLVA